MFSSYYYNQFLINFDSEYKIATVLLVKFAATEFILSFELKFGRVGLNIPLVSTFPIFSEAAFGAENLCILCRKLMQFVNFVPNFCCFAGISFKILFWLKKIFLEIYCDPARAQIWENNTFNFFTFLFPLPVPSKKMVVICARAKYKFDQSGVSGKSTLLRALERRPQKKYYSQVLWFSLTQEQEPKGLFMQ